MLSRCEQRRGLTNKRRVLILCCVEACAHGCPNDVGMVCLGVMMSGGWGGARKCPREAGRHQNHANAVPESGHKRYQHLSRTPNKHKESGDRDGAQNGAPGYAPQFEFTVPDGVTTLLVPEQRRGRYGYLLINPDKHGGGTGEISLRKFRSNYDTFDVF